MGGLIETKLSGMPIGTHLELTYEDYSSHLKKIYGILTDSDFASEIEIQPENGPGILLNSAVIRAVQPVRMLSAVIRGTEPGTDIVFSFGDGDPGKPTMAGTLLARKGSALQIRLQSGVTVSVDAGQIRSFLLPAQTPDFRLPEQKPEPEEVPREEPEENKDPAPGPGREESAEQTDPSVQQEIPAEPFYQRKPRRFPIPDEAHLQQLFTAADACERRLLGSCHDSFFHGVKMSDADKMHDAALRIGRIVLDEYEGGYDWTDEGLQFCIGVMETAGCYNPDLPLMRFDFSGAAYASYEVGDEINSGACAVLALEDCPVQQEQTLLTLLAVACAGTEDYSGLQIYCDNQQLQPGSDGEKMVLELLAEKDILPQPGESLGDAVFRLRGKYESTEMDQEIRYWIEQKQEAEEHRSGKEPEPVREETPLPEDPTRYGMIRKLNWSISTGVIVDDSGQERNFAYSDVSDPRLEKFLKTCFQTDLGGNYQAVTYRMEGQTPVEIGLDAGLIDRAKAICANGCDPQRHEKALKLLDRAILTGRAEMALPDFFHEAALNSEAGGDRRWADRAVELYRQREPIRYELPATNAFVMVNIARCQLYREEYGKAAELAQKAMKVGGYPLSIRGEVMQQGLTVLRECYRKTGEKKLLSKMENLIREIRDDCSQELRQNPAAEREFEEAAAPFLTLAACGRGRLEEAEEHLNRVSKTDPARSELKGMIKTARNQQEERRKEAAYPKEEIPEAPAPVPAVLPQEPEEPEEPEEAPAAPYEDRDGWQALGMSEQDVAERAMQMEGPDRLAPMIAYLHAGAALCDGLAPLYRTASLAANDPETPWNHTVSELVTVCADSEQTYAEFTRWCRAAAFLRAAYFAPEGYRYGVRQFCDTLEVTGRLPEYAAVCTTLLDFLQETGSGIDLYAADQHSPEDSGKKQMENAAEDVRELYEKYILTPPREGAKCMRLMETKKIAFAREGCLSTLLETLISGEPEAVEKQKREFTDRFLIGAGNLADARLNEIAIEALICDCWDQAGRQILVRKVNDTVQGNGRSNLHAIFTEILDAARRWYAAAEHGGDRSWFTETGRQAWEKAEPILAGQLAQLRQACGVLEQQSGNPEEKSGAFLLGAAAEELEQHLTGVLRSRQNRFFYADFLRGDEVLLTENYLPDLSGSFCILPEFNILSRIQRHLTTRAGSLREHFGQIWSQAQAGNYGCAEQILHCLRETGCTDVPARPENAGDFLDQSSRQARQRCVNFREEYALARARGQIAAGDLFAADAPEIVRYWYEWAEDTRNYGFFREVVRRCSERLHRPDDTGAEHLMNELERLVPDHPEIFAAHPEWAEAVREQIRLHNDTVAEDWLRRIRCGSWSPEVRIPWAAACQDRFWDSIPEIFGRVSNAGRTLSVLLRQDRGKKIAVRQLTDHWIGLGSPAGAERVMQLMQLLGWSPVTAARCPNPVGSGCETYEVTMAPGGRISQHPVAAFGSGMRERKLTAVCLSGAHDSAGLCRKLGSLNEIPGGKVVFLDCALGQADRRELACRLKQKKDGLREPCLLIDRVLITYLNDHYDENTVSRMVMALSLPESFCQPYGEEFSPEMFFGRERELSQLRSPDGPNLVEGGFGIGKSSLLRRLALDLGTGSSRKVLAADLAGSGLEQAVQTVDDALWEARFEPLDPTAYPEPELSDLVRNAVSQMEEGTVLWMLLDDADGLLHSDDGLAAVRALSELEAENDSFRFVLAAEHTPQEAEQAGLRLLELPPMEEQSALALLTEPLSYLGFRFENPADLSLILGFCEYDPGLIRCFASKLVEAVREEDYGGYNSRFAPPYVITDVQLRHTAADPELLARIRNRLRRLIDDPRRSTLYGPLLYLLVLMSRMSAEETSSTAEEILAQARDLKVQTLKDLDASRLERLLHELCERNVLCENPNGSWSLRFRRIRDQLGTDDELMEYLMGKGDAQ